jgi:hypothetical protein
VPGVSHAQVDASDLGHVANAPTRVLSLTAPMEYEGYDRGLVLKASPRHTHYITTTLPGDYML